MNRPEPDVDLGRMPYNFSIVGVQKSGTSTLSGTISQHRLVCRPPRKEAHFFNDEYYDWAHPDYERDYTAPRRAKVHTMVGDSTPVYLFWPNALERMRDYMPATAAHRGLPRPAGAALLALDDAPHPAPRLAGLAGVPHRVPPDVPARHRCRPT